MLKWQEEKGLGYGNVVSHKEHQLPAKPNCYRKESPIRVNLVPVQNKYENKCGIWKSVGDRFARKF
jgi:hypothetical protein